MTRFAPIDQVLNATLNLIGPSALVELQPRTLRKVAVK